MLALAFALSYVKMWEMPLGGSITLASMLPIMLISVKYGTRVGISTAFVYSLTQLFQGFMSGTVYWAMSGGVLTVAILFDYIVPFTLIGLAGFLRKRGEWGIYIGMAVSVFLRFVCHYVTGVTIWSQWTPDGYSSYVYSLLYNGGYLLPDFIILIAVAVLMLRVKQMRKLLGLK
jgi:thiamine transporter